MTVWLLRAGRSGERQDFALDNGVAVLGADVLPDIGSFPSKEELRAFFEEKHPNAKRRAIGAWTGQAWNFANGVAKGDLIALPLKGQAAIAIGRCAGVYSHQPANPAGARHVLPVTWIRQDVPRDAFPSDILNSLGSLLAVSQLRAENAEARILAVAQGKPQPPALQHTNGHEVVNEEQMAPLDIESVANDGIRRYISQGFAGHALAEIVDAVLKAQGYHTQVSPPGPDGGVDIIAGRGPMGFDPPRLLVQVKATKTQQDVKVLRELKGVMSDYRADQGLFVSWGGFTRNAVNEARKAYFEVRLWDSGDLVAAILRHYDQFSDALRAELPLKRVWTLVPEEAE